MVRHVVMFRWNAEATPGRLAAVAEGLASLPGIIPEIEAYRFGPDLGLVEGNADFVVVADFADADAYRTYRDHPDHQALIAAAIAPLIEVRMAIQYEVE